MHNNLFGYGADENEVYAKLQQDYKRDHRQLQFMDLATIALIIYLVRDLPRLDAIAIVVIVLLILSRLNTFIDNSNRNFFMHQIDWLDARERARGEAQ